MIDLGCNFTFDDLKKITSYDNYIVYGANIIWGATVIINMRYSEESRIACSEKVLENGNDEILYSCYMG